MSFATQIKLISVASSKERVKWLMYCDGMETCYVCHDYIAGHSDPKYFLRNLKDNDTVKNNAGYTKIFTNLESVIMYAVENIQE